MVSADDRKLDYITCYLAKRTVNLLKICVGLQNPKLYIMSKKKVLNLHAGLGGNSKDWDRNKYHITSVELEPKIAKVYQDNNPNDEVIINDAMDYLKKHRNEYDFIWASPPCQKHSRMMKATRHDVADYFDASLYQIIIFLTHFYKGKWVVENVKPSLTSPVVLKSYTSIRLVLKSAKNISV